MRKARVLLGWLDDSQAAHFLSGFQGGTVLNEEQKKQVEQARRSVAGRAVHVDSNPIQDAPASLANHIAAVEKSAPAKVFLGQGWKVVMADLRQVRAIQPLVYVDYAESSVAAVNPDLASIAAASLPLPTAINLPASFDQQRQTWIISSPNLNLQITGVYGGQVQLGPDNTPTVFGFTIAAPPSFMQVAKFRGKFVLRDGTHRAHGFVSRKIYIVPCFYKEFGQHEELGVGPMGLISADTYLGDRPPFLSDYSSNTVSVETTLPSSSRTIVIPGLQLSQNS
jgi:hypothetical protein